jgi:SAM-dependent methyltransferase
MGSSDRIGDKTIADFGVQWNTYRDNEGFYGSQQLFADILGPLLSQDDIAGRDVADIGSGTGRIVRMLLNAGARRVVAVEPSAAFEVLVANLRPFQDQVKFVHGPGEALGHAESLDAVFSIGVLHHVPDPDPIVRTAHRSLKPGGRLVVWLYGKEGNRSYILLLSALRLLSKSAPHRLVAGLAWLLYGPLSAYIWLCRWLHLPLRAYMTEVIGKMSPEKRRLVIYDQLNPAYAKYYTRSEARDLLARNGFEEVALHHRHGYSWTVMGTKRGPRPEISKDGA